MWLLALLKFTKQYKEPCQRIQLSTKLYQLKRRLKLLRRHVVRVVCNRCCTSVQQIRQGCVAFVLFCFSAAAENHARP